MNQALYERIHPINMQQNNKRNSNRFFLLQPFYSGCFFFSSPRQKPGGLMFPDRASLYVVAIEDRQYKDYKIHCEYRGRVGCVCVYVFTRIGPRSVFPALTGGKKIENGPDIATPRAVAGRPARSEAFAAPLISLNFLSGGAEGSLIVISRQQACPSPYRLTANPPQWLCFAADLQSACGRVVSQK